jgi:internalin A
MPNAWLCHADDEASDWRRWKKTSVTDEQVSVLTKQMFAAGLSPSRHDARTFVPAHNRTLHLNQIPDSGLPFGLILAAFNTTPDALAGLQQNGTLNSLSLLGVQDGAACLQAVERQTNLRFLSLHECGVTDDHISQLTNLKQLETLDLRKTKILGPGLAELKSLAALESLEVDMTEKQFSILVDSGLVHLLPIAHGIDRATARTDADIVELELNGFYGYEVTDEMMKSLDRLTSLRQLSLIETHVTNDAIPQTLCFPHLETLNLERTRIDDGALRILETANSLKSLILDETRITAEGLMNLSKCTSLTELHLNRCRLDDASLASLGVMPNLEKLQVGETKICFENDVLPATFLNLKYLNVNGSKVTDSGIPAIAQLPSLRSLDLTLCHVGDEGMRSLAECRNLEVLFLNRTAITDDALRQLASIGTLQTLSLHSTNVSDVGLPYLAGMKNLRSLILFGTPTSESGVQQLQELLPQCEISR